jgi:hypothetical protein
MVILVAVGAVYAALVIFMGAAFVLARRADDAANP